MWTRLLLTLSALLLTLAVSTVAEENAWAPSQELPLVQCLSAFGRPNPLRCSQALTHLHSNRRALWWVPPTARIVTPLQCGHQWHLETCYITMNCHAATPVLTGDIAALAAKAIRECGNTGSVAVPKASSNWWLTITDRPIRPIPDNKSVIETLERSLAAYTLLHMRMAASATGRGGRPSVAGIPQWAVRRRRSGDGRRSLEADGLLL